MGVNEEEVATTATTTSEYPLEGTWNLLGRVELSAL